MPQYRDLDSCSAFRRLATLPAPDCAGLLTPGRIAECDIDAGGGLVFNYAATGLDAGAIGALGDLAAEQELVSKYIALASGAVMNTGENRMVLHHLTRGAIAGPVIRQDRDFGEFYERERERAAAFARAVHSGAILGSKGRRFTTVVQIGIGGSDLGPRALYLALERRAVATGTLRMRARFISNVDPDDADSVLAGIDLAESLFILVSKSGTTQETLANEQLVRARLAASGCDPARHMAAVTSETSPLAGNPDYLESFYIDDFIGGRYSSTSAVGGVVLSLAFGGETFSDLLAGAHEADLAATNPSPSRNAAMLDALIGVYQRTVLGMGATAILPYSEALSRFPAHLQQLDMESNGKRFDREGRPLSYSTGPIVFGEPGTNGQHSFYQLLHQGTDPVPLQFIGFSENQLSADFSLDGSDSRTKLCANLAAQIVAFARGKDDADPSKRFPGGRPSTLLRGRNLGPRELGALLAHYENKVMFQGFAWNLNSFDQEGVQLGKVLARKVLSGAKDDPALAAYARMIHPGLAYAGE